MVLNLNFIPFLDQHVIKHKINYPYTSKQNGIVERKHRRHIMEMGLTLLSQATLPLSFSDGGFSTSVYLINCLPAPILYNISPLEKLLAKNLTFFPPESLVANVIPTFNPTNLIKCLSDPHHVLS